MAYRIEICAPMGVGKTTAARALAAHGYHVVEEDPAANPHLAEFYATFSPEAAFKKDSWFAAHVRACIKSGGDKNIVMDFALVLCRAYVDAGVNTPENAHKLQRVFDGIDRDLGAPDLLIVIDLPLDEQIKRITARQRAGEEAVPQSYLQTLRDAVAKRVEAAAQTGANILRIDGNKYDLRDPAQGVVFARMVQAALATRRVTARRVNAPRR